MTAIDWPGVFHSAWPICFGWVLGILSPLVAAGINSYRTRKRKRIMAHLAAGYAIGVELRNQAIGLTPKAKRDKWRVQWMDWKGRIVADARELDYAKAENVNTLGTFSAARFANVDPDIEFEVSVLTETLGRLSTFLAEVS